VGAFFSSSTAELQFLQRQRLLRCGLPCHILSTHLLFLIPSISCLLYLSPLFVVSFVKVRMRSDNTVIEEGKEESWWVEGMECAVK
jgi:hypothetical protein